MIDCIRKMFELFVQKRWLKEINRQINAVNRAIRKTRQAQQSADRKHFVLQKLIDEYNARYHDGLGVKEVYHTGGASNV